MKLNTRDAAVAILSKAKTPEEATIGFDVNELKELDALIKAAKSKMDSAKVSETCKTDKNGQWKIEKAIKPGPTLDYSKMNPKPNRAAQEANAPVIDYSNNSVKEPKRYAGAKEHAEAVRAKLDAEAKEPALETISRRQKMAKQDGMAAFAGSVKNAFGGGSSNPPPPPPPAPTSTSSSGSASLGSKISGSVGRAMGKDEGVLLDKEPSPAEKKKMTISKDESEPHKDDPRHEEKEKKKAKKIKEEAEGILDMHEATKTEGQQDC